MRMTMKRNPDKEVFCLASAWMMRMLLMMMLMMMLCAEPRLGWRVMPVMLLTVVVVVVVVVVC